MQTHPIVERLDGKLEFLPGDVIQEDAVSECRRHRDPLQTVAVLDALEQGLPQMLRIEKTDVERDAELLKQVENPLSFPFGQLPAPRAIHECT